VITIVSGLPRSGTSMMMQMLAAGGMPILGDTERRDESNPRGYYEWPEITQFPANPKIIAQAEGKAVKLTSNFLCFLPPEHEYKIILMERPLSEVLPSMEKMQRLQHPEDEAAAKAIAAPEFREALESLQREVRHWAETTLIPVQPVSYGQALGDPRETALLVELFLRRFLCIDPMVRAVEPTLYRTKVSAEPTTSTHRVLGRYPSHRA
jgi:hypothetical protein